MEIIFFEWDETKNQINQRKHGIDFDEAKTVFYDDNASHCYRSEDNIIRIISARKATKNEIKTYNDYAGGDIL